MWIKCLKRAAAGLCFVLAVGACAAVDPVTGPPQGGKAAAGAGADTPAGAALNRYMGDQETDLRECLRDSGVKVWRAGDQIILNMPAGVVFAGDSAGIKTSFHDVLKAVCLVLKAYDQTTLEVVGHTDSVGSDTRNQALSRNRAQAVARFVTSQGVAPSRLAIGGMGGKQPIASNDTPEGRSRNRRVELRIMPTPN